MYAPALCNVSYATFQVVVLTPGYSMFVPAAVEAGGPRLATEGGRLERQCRGGESAAVLQRQHTIQGETGRQRTLVLARTN